MAIIILLGFCLFLSGLRGAARVIFSNWAERMKTKFRNTQPNAHTRTRLRPKNPYGLRCAQKSGQSPWIHVNFISASTACGTEFWAQSSLPIDGCDGCVAVGVAQMAKQILLFRSVANAKVWLFASKCAQFNYVKQIVPLSLPLAFRTRCRCTHRHLILVQEPSNRTILVLMLTCSQREHGSAKPMRHFRESGCDFFGCVTISFHSFSYCAGLAAAAAAVAAENGTQNFKETKLWTKVEATQVKVPLYSEHIRISLTLVARRSASFPFPLCAACAFFPFHVHAGFGLVSNSQNANMSITPSVPSS